MDGGPGRVMTPEWREHVECEACRAEQIAYLVRTTHEVQWMCAYCRHLTIDPAEHWSDH